MNAEEVYEEIKYFLKRAELRFCDMNKVKASVHEGKLRLEYRNGGFYICHDIDLAEEA